MLEINGTLLVTFVIVWILVIVLTRVFFRPLQKVRGDRAAKLFDDREASRRALDENARDLQDVDNALKAARAQGALIRDELEAEAFKEKSSLLAEVGQAAKIEIEKARDDMNRELDGLKAELASRAAGLALQIERRLLQ
jgi:F0F1-type ATP synthase membrane subunit b/b'